MFLFCLVKLNSLHSELANQMADSMVFPLIQFREKDLTGRQFSYSTIQLYMAVLYGIAAHHNISYHCPCTVICTISPYSCQYTPMVICQTWISLVCIFAEISTLKEIFGIATDGEYKL